MIVCCRTGSCSKRHHVKSSQIVDTIATIQRLGDGVNRFGTLMVEHRCRPFDALSCRTDGALCEPGRNVRAHRPEFHPPLRGRQFHDPTRPERILQCEVALHVDKTPNEVRTLVRQQHDNCPAEAVPHKPCPAGAKRLDSRGYVINLPCHAKQERIFAAKCPVAQQIDRMDGVIFQTRLRPKVVE